MNHFQNTTDQICVGEVPDKNPENAIITGWKACDFDISIIAPITAQDKTDLSYVYCQICNQWLAYNRNTTSLRNHRITAKHRRMQAKLDKFVKASIKVSDPNITNNIIAFILSSGLPFSLIENKFLRAIDPSLPCRQRLAKISVKIDEIIKAEIEKRILGCNSLSLIIDEWKDKNKRSYLGISLQGFSNSGFVANVIAFRKIHAEHIDHCVIADLVDSVRSSYSISDKTTFFITDNASTMIKAFEEFNRTWFPCIAHTSNLLLGDIIAQLRAPIKEIKNFQKHVAHSGVFRSYLENHKAEYFSIPSYTPTRWYSLYGMVHCFSTLKNDILNYYLANNDNPIHCPSAEAFEFASYLSPILEHFQEVMELLESDSFGAISRADFLFKALFNPIKELVQSGSIFVISQCFSNYEVLWTQRYMNIAGKWGKRLWAAALLNPNHLYRSTLEDYQLTEGKNWLLEMIRQFEIPIATCIHTQTALTKFMEAQQKFIPSPEQELESYLLTNRNVELDKLEKFWLDNQQSWPRLSKVALQLLSIPPSSTRTERLFSKSRKIFGDDRLRLTEEHSESSVLCFANKELFEVIISQL